MAENYAFFNGNVIRMSDDPIQEFVGEVALVRSLYGHGEYMPGSLAEHAGDLTEIATNLANTGYAADGTNRQNDFWREMVGLSYRDETPGSRFRDAYVYVRTNRILASEFGPAESPTVDVIRSVANGIFKARQAKTTGEAMWRYLDAPFAQDILDSVYPEPYSPTIPSTELEDYLSRLDDENINYMSDSALARIVAALSYLSCGLLKEIPRKAIVESLQANRDIFTHSSSKRKIISPLDDDETVDNEESEPEEYTTGNDESLPEYSSGTTSSEVFDISQGECFVTREPGMPEEEWLELRAQMNRLMFPSDGVGVTLARNICKECVVKGSCLDFALETRIDHGIWGGVSERERRRMLALRPSA